MRIALPALEIGDTEGFDPKKDIFGRKSVGEGLANLLSSVSDPMVLAIDGQWGSGKTVFLKMLGGHLRTLGFPVIYFDAFEHDIQEDAFSALASELFDLANASQNPKAADLKKWAVKVAKVVGRGSLKLGVKFATAGILEAEDFGDIAKDVGSEASAITDQHIGEWLTRSKERKATIAAFKEALRDFPALLDQLDEVGSKPLIFIIDELDRCRPIFALELLEKVKHLFSVQNVHFVLGVHMGQLESSVSAVYGANIDSKQYLQKFVQVVMHLPENREPNTATAQRFALHLRQALQLDDGGADTASEVTETIAHFARTRGLSFRAIERAMTYVALGLAFTPKNFFRPPPILGGLCLLKVIRPDLFVKAKIGALTYKDVEPIFDLLPIGCDHNAFQGERRQLRASMWWKFCTLDPLDDPDIPKQFQSAMFHYSVFGEGRLKLVAYVANDIIDRLEPR